MRVNLIYARARNGVIGANGTLPWHLPQDLAHFKRQTMGAPVLMGRKTWDSLPPRFRPLPGRANIVVTRQRHWQAAGAQAAHSLPEALTLCSAIDPPAAEVWVIGGAELFTSALPQAQRLIVTELEQDFAGDVFAPPLGEEWHETAREHHGGDATALAHAFVTYERVGQATC